MDIRIATTAAEIAACFGVLRELRQQLDEAGFVAWVHDQASQGYVLAYVNGPSGPVSVAGYRIADRLAWGRYLAVEDMATLSPFRSQRMGAALADWLLQTAREAGCTSVQVDAPVGAEGLRRFCERQGFAISAHHYSRQV